jgi:hypothetical protein
VLVTPIPPYIPGKCCDDQVHIDNFFDKNFDESIVAGLDTARLLLDTWGTELGLSYVIINPVAIANSGDLELRMRRTSEETS